MHTQNESLLRKSLKTGANRLLLSVSMIAFASVSGAALAADDEIVVTATKREQSIQDTSIAVTAFNGEQLREFGFSSSIDLAAQTPGLKISPVFGAGNIPNIAIRGVGLNDFRDYHESPSAVYVDEVYKAALGSLDFQLFDVDRAEVLKGPQGTLFGRNATGGLIQYITKKPGKEAEFDLFGSYGTRNELKVEGGATLPLGDIISTRISGIYHKHDGVQRNLNPAGVNANQLDMWGVRGQIAIEPTDAFSVLLTAEAGENQNDGGNPYRYRPSFFGADGLAQTDFANIDAVVGSSDKNDINVSGGLGLNSKSRAYTGRIEWDLGGATLTSISNYQTYEKTQTQDCDSAPVDFCFTRYRADADQFSQEVRLQGTVDRLDWDLGFYYLDYQITGRQGLAGPIADLFFGPAIPPVTTADTLFDTGTKSWAVFGQLSYALSEDLRVTGGLRYTEDNKDISQTFVVIDGNAAAGFVFDQTTIGDLAKQNDDNISFLGKLEWTPSDDLLFYGGVSRAAKSGTFNTGFAPVALSNFTVLPEQLTSYEVGFKSTVGGGTTRVNGAAFYYDYKDHQAFVFQNLTQTLFNADAEVFGVELELNSQPTDELELSLGISLLDTKVKDVQDRSGAIRDRDMVTAPEASVNAMARYTADLGNAGSLSFQVDGNYSSSVFFDNLNSPALREGAYAIGNARIAWRDQNERFEISGWVQNFTDANVRDYAFDLTGDLGYVQDLYHAPRWFGVGVSVNY